MATNYTPNHQQLTKKVNFFLWCCHSHNITVTIVIYCDYHPPKKNSSILHLAFNSKQLSCLGDFFWEGPKQQRQHSCINHFNVTFIHIERLHLTLQSAICAEKNAMNWRLEMLIFNTLQSHLAHLQDNVCKFWG